MARVRSSAPAIKRRASVVPDRAQQSAPPAAPATITLDLYRTFVFPNRIREQRRRQGLQKLMALSERLPDIPYIRLSKIERGEVFARATEMHRIANALDCAPTDLLIDPNRSGFDIAAWAQPFQDSSPASTEEERFAVLLAAALRVLRQDDATLTIATLDKDYGLPAVILSRLENAYKTLDRWNHATVAAVCRLFDVADEAALRKLVMHQYRQGKLNALVGMIADPKVRLRRTRERNAALLAELAPGAPPDAHRRQSPAALASPTPGVPAIAAPQPGEAVATEQRDLPVFGAALPGGLIALTPTAATVDAPRDAGARAFALRVCRATLGAGLPADAIVVVDPDRAPKAGGLAAIRTGEAYRLVSVTFDRMGASRGYSVVPDLEVYMDELDPADVCAVIAAIFP